MKSIKVAALDLEATGLINPDVPIEYQPRIIEIGAVSTELTPKMAFSLETFSELVYPEMGIPEEVIKITGITNEMVKDVDSFKTVHRRFAKFMTGVDLLFTFNGPAYDMPVLMFNLQRHNLQYQFPWPRLHIDLMTAASDYLGLVGKTGNKVPKLMELYQFLFGKEFGDAHRALNDAQATLDAGRELLRLGIIKIGDGIDEDLEGSTNKKLTQKG